MSDWVTTFLQAAGAFGVAMPTPLENVFPPIPSGLSCRLQALRRRVGTCRSPPPSSAARKARSPAPGCRDGRAGGWARTARSALPPGMGAGSRSRPAKPNGRTRGSAAMDAPCSSWDAWFPACAR